MEGGVASVAREQMPLLMMDNLLEQLKMLDYEDNCTSLKPLT